MNRITSLALLVFLFVFSDAARVISEQNDDCDCNQANPNLCYDEADKVIKTMPNCYERNPQYKDKQRRVLCFLKKACDKNVGIACYKLAAHMRGCGDGGETPEEVALFKKSCDLEYLEGCVIYAEHLDDDTHREKKQKLFLQACQSKIGGGCMDLVWMIEKRHTGISFNGAGISLPESESLNGDSVKYLEQGCVYGNMGCCGSLGNYFRKRDPKKALSYYELVCNDDGGVACCYAGRIEEESKNYDRAIKLLERGKALSKGPEDWVNAEDIEKDIARVKEEKKNPTSMVWKDSRSGLTWQISPTGGDMEWADAIEHCKSLSSGGHSDWRLPTISELRSLIRGCPATQKGGSCGVTDSCSKVGCGGGSCSRACSAKGGPGPGGAYWPPEISGKVDVYWSSSRVLEKGGARFDENLQRWTWSGPPDPGEAANYAWHVDFYNANISGCTVKRKWNVRCVRRSPSRR